MKRNEWVDNYIPSDVLEINHAAVYSGCFPELAASVTCSREHLGNDPAFCTLIFHCVVISANRTPVKTKCKRFLLLGNQQVHVGISPENTKGKENERGVYSQNN